MGTRALCGWSAHQGLKMRLALVVVLVIALAGCTTQPGEGPIIRPTAGTPTAPPPVGPPLVFGGTLRDALTAEPILTGEVRVDLAQVQPCGRQSIGWTSWVPKFDNGTWGPLELPRPRSDDVAFFVHGMAPGYSANATFIGPEQARSGISNMTVLLHPDADIRGRAPAGTLLALDSPGFPRVIVAAANGTYEFPHARGVNATLAAGTDVPVVATVRAPGTLDIVASAERGWRLEGSIIAPNGAPVSADVVAWNGTQLVSVARSSSAGAFSLPLVAEPGTFRVEARTSDGHFGGSSTLEIAGPPALRERILLRALC